MMVFRIEEEVGAAMQMHKIEEEDDPKPGQSTVKKEEKEKSTTSMK
jgi:hypothetical protein